MSIPWWEIKVSHIPDLEDTIFWELQEWGAQGTALVKEEDSWFIKAYIPSLTKQTEEISDFTEQLKQKYQSFYEESFLTTWKLINDEDWAISWKQHWQPMDIGQKFTVYPAWIEPPTNSERIILRLDPGSAFGTGVHATTQLCLESLEMRLDESAREQTIADIGCGSGILSIGAKLLGAKKVYATDIDPLAVIATKKNQTLNHIEDIEVFEGGIDQLLLIPGLKFDGIVCNILAEVIKTMIPTMTKIIKPEGWIALSGILVNQSSEIANLLESDGWTIASIWKRGEWSCINARR